MRTGNHPNEIIVFHFISFVKNRNYLHLWHSPVHLLEYQTYPVTLRFHQHKRRAAQEV